jgi:hypothetical protein
MESLAGETGFMMTVGMNNRQPPVRRPLYRPPSARQSVGLNVAFHGQPEILAKIDMGKAAKPGFGKQMLRNI